MRILASPHLLSPLLVALLVCAACSDDAARSPSSADTDERTDSGAEEKPDPDASTPTSSKTDSGDEVTDPVEPGSGAPEGSMDGGHDDGEASPPPSEDAAPAPEEDASSPPDTGAPDAGDPDEAAWSGCPDADWAPSDPNWPVLLTVTEEAVYCATFHETRTLKEELAAKLQLRVAPGEYQLPAEDHPDYALAVCLRDRHGRTSAPDHGQTQYSEQPSGDNLERRLLAQTTFKELGQLNARLQHSVKPGENPAFILDGKEADINSFDSYTALELCSEPGEQCFPAQMFTSCEFSSGQLNTHDVTLDKGQIRFELRLGQSFAGTEPGAYVRASGSFEGVAFDQTDYFKLIYHPTHHHFERTFAVLFDEPIAGACGIEVHALERFGDDVPDEAYTLDCELNRLEPLSVEEHELTLE